MASFFTDNGDLRFYVEKAIDWHTLARSRDQEIGLNKKTKEIRRGLHSFDV
jgi:hypothetical protein